MKDRPVEALLDDKLHSGAFKGTAPHVRAIHMPVRFEGPIIRIARELARYADQHAATYESPIGEDGVLGREWETMARSLIGLLNGDTGRLDCGTVDGAIRAMGKAAGVNLDD